MQLPAVSTQKKLPASDRSAAGFHLQVTAFQNEHTAREINGNKVDAIGRIWHGSESEKKNNTNEMMALMMSMLLQYIYIHTHYEIN